VLAGLLPRLLARSVTAGLKRVRIPSVEVDPLDRKAIALASARAMGSPTLVILLLATVAMATLGAYEGIAEGDWAGWVLLGVMIPGSIYMGKQLWLLGAAEEL
jgi:hypothetical protein